MKKEILIIDDSEMLLGLMKYCYSQTFELFLCKSLNEAKALLKKGLFPDVIITDLNLPDEDGKIFISFIKTNPIYRGIPVIVLSGEEESHIRIECLKLGADDYIIKPFNPKELQLCIEKLITAIPASITTFRLNFDISRKVDAKNVNFFNMKYSFHKPAFGRIKHQFFIVN
jgi:DNA-binding response OmpR family regulator